VYPVLYTPALEGKQSEMQRAVGLYKLNSVDHSLKAPGFNHYTYQVISWFQILLSNSTCNQYSAAVERALRETRAALADSFYAGLMVGGCTLVMSGGEIHARVQPPSTTTSCRVQLLNSVYPP
jgi:hypothetical protein